MVVAEAVAVAVEVECDGTVQEPVEHGGGDGGVAKRHILMVGVAEETSTDGVMDRPAIELVPWDPRWLPIGMVDHTPGEPSTANQHQLPVTPVPEELVAVDSGHAEILAPVVTPPARPRHTAGSRPKQCSDGVELALGLLALEQTGIVMVDEKVDRQSDRFRARDPELSCLPTESCPLRDVD